MEFTPVRKISSYEMIVEQIEAAIRSGELAVGDRLPGERQLMERFSVSRPTVREAMRVLHATGVVDPRPGDPRGPVVLPFSTKALERPLRRMTEQEGISRAELLQFRLLVEGQAALLAAAPQEGLEEIRARAEALAELAAAQDLGQEQDPVEEFGRRLSAFHTAIRAASGNQLLQVCGAAVDGALTELARRRLDDETDAPSRKERLSRSAQDAQALTELISSGEAAQARCVATQNIYRFYRDRLDQAEREALEPLVDD